MTGVWVNLDPGREAVDRGSDWWRWRHESFSFRPQRIERETRYWAAPGKQVIIRTRDEIDVPPPPGVSGSRRPSGRESTSSPLVFPILIAGFSRGPYLQLLLRAMITCRAAKSEARNIQSTPGSGFKSRPIQAWYSKRPAAARWLTLRQRASSPRSASTPPSRRCGATSRARAGSVLCPER